MLLSAFIVVIADRKKSSVLDFNFIHLQTKKTKKIPSKATGPENQRIGQPIAS
jgi:hypothetical protein